MIMECPSCHREWNIVKNNTCQCGVTIKIESIKLKPDPFIEYLDSLVDLNKATGTMPIGEIVAKREICRMIISIKEKYIQLKNK